MNIYIILLIVLILLYILKKSVTDNFTTNTNKIAFLFITYENHSKYNLIEKYFENIDKSKYTIYSHAKNSKNVTNPLIKNNLIKKYIDSKWGRFSIYEIMYELLRQAYKDPLNKYFLFISDSTIPIKSFNNLYTYLMNNNKSFIESMNIPKHQTNLLFKLQEKSDILKKASQWVCLNRKHTKILLDSYKKAFELFQTEFKTLPSIKFNITIPDEFVIPTILNLTLENYNDEIIDKNLTIVKWKNCNINNIEPIIKKSSPCEYLEITDSELNTLINGHHFFIRKINKKCILNENILINLFDK